MQKTMDMSEEQNVETRLKPVMILVFSLKLAVAALLVGHLALPHPSIASPELVAAAR
ncbi:hypothetical protein ACQ3G6_12155 [Allorhizobium undicola]|uniref:hypothetical protein n=1 Tax=Allorhizobium undicola TaxID=78527 RepID=UPI0012B62FBE|nr:hypothetical protein [Allorhizobium undicola]